MPDKHEVGGSSPLGPTNFLEEKRDKWSPKRISEGVRVHLGQPAGEDLQPKGKRPQELNIKLLKHLKKI